MSTTARERIDLAMAAALAVTTIVGLLALGAAHPVCRFALEMAMGIVIVTWALAGSGGIARLALAPVLSGLVLLQLLPLPDGLLVAVAPISGGAWKLALAGLPEAWGRITIDPAATAAGSRRLLLVVGAAIVAADLAAKRRPRHLLTAALATAGVLIWALGIIFPRNGENDLLLGLIDINGPLQVWVSPVLAPVESAGAANVNVVNVGTWRYPVADGLVGDGFGPFISSNQFAGAMCLTVPFIMAWWLRLTHNAIPSLLRMSIVAVTVAGAAWTTGMMAGSRGGGAACLVGGLSFLLLTAHNDWWRVMLLGLALTLGAAIVALAAATAGLTGPIDSLLPAGVGEAITQLTRDNRTIGIAAGLRMVWASPIAGTGVNSYGEIFARFNPGRWTLFYAHNDYIQCLAETGLLGASTCAVLAALTARRGVSWFRGQTGIDRIDAAAPLSALIGFASHECVEWNLHLPGISLAAAVGLGLFAPCAAIATGTSRPRTVVRVMAITGLIAATIVSIVLLGRDMMSERTAKEMRRALVTDRIVRNRPEHPSAVPLMQAAVTMGETAIPWDPANAGLPLLLGQLHLHLAARSTTEESAAEHTEIARSWFARATQRRAICFGLPEAVPPPPARSKAR